MQSSREMRILLITETLTAGGAETFVVRLANALAPSHQVTIAVMHGEMVHPAVARHVDRRVGVERLLLPRKRLWFKADSLLRRIGIDFPILHRIQKGWLQGIIERRQPDILHSHLLKADRLASELSGDGPGRGHVITMHGDYAPFLEGQADAQMLNIAARIDAIIGRADAIVGVSAEQLDYLAARYRAAAGKSHLIYNGYAPQPVDPERRTRSSLGLPENTFLFGMVARGVKLKGWERAIAAFERLERNNALILVGEGPALDELRRAGAPENVIFTGFSANPIEYIRHFDVGLLPTLFAHESLPTVVIEYLCEGKPVIATDVGEIGTMIRAPKGEMGGTLLSFNGDISIDDLAAAMQHMIDDPGLWRRQSDLARQAFAKFDMEECARRYVRLYEEVLAGSISSPIKASH